MAPLGVDVARDVLAPAEFLVEQLARDRSREVWGFCDELALLSQYAEDVDALDADGWRTVLEQVVRAGRAEIIEGVARFVRESAEERRASAKQGSLF